MSKTSHTLLVVTCLLFCYIQYISTNKIIFFEKDKAQQAEVLVRMNLYPPSLSRLSNIVENRKEFTLFFKLEDNFTSIFSFEKYNKNYFTLLTLVISLYLLYKFIAISPQKSLSVLTIPIICLTILGSDNKYGPICLVPILTFSLIHEIYQQ